MPVFRMEPLPVSVSDTVLVVFAATEYSVSPSSVTVAANIADVVLHIATTSHFCMVFFLLYEVILSKFRRVVKWFKPKVLAVRPCVHRNVVL